MRKIIFSFFILIGMVSCMQNKTPENKTTIDCKAEIIKTDRDFSKLSEEKGVKAAFLEYIDSEGVLLRPNSMPLISANAIDFISQENDTSYSMSWEPQGGYVANSGELGYTYGTYLIKFKNKDSVVRGTYLSVWKKQPDGKWKFVIDTGNEGLSQP
jgi:ketosteroid isomerase-like protein